jgi:hypothetical protein
VCDGSIATEAVTIHFKRAGVCKGRHTYFSGNIYLAICPYGAFRGSFLLNQDFVLNQERGVRVLPGVHTMPCWSALAS